MKAYSIDLRQRVLDAWLAGEATQAELAKRYRVSPRWISEMVRRHREGQSIAPKPRGGNRRPAFDAPARAKLLNKVKQQPGLTLEQLRDWAQRELGIECSFMAVDRALRKEDQTFKKRRSGRPSSSAKT